MDTPFGPHIAPESVSDDLVVVGRVGAAHGVRGHFKVHSFTEPFDNLLAYQPWHMQWRDQWYAPGFIEVRPAGGNRQFMFARLEQLNDRDAIRAITGCYIGVPRNVLPGPDADEYYWRDLTGMSVQNRSGVTLGTVSDLMETGANDVLVIKDETQQRLIPFVAQYIDAVDVAGRLITVDWDLEWDQ